METANNFGTIISFNPTKLDQWLIDNDNKHLTGLLEKIKELPCIERLERMSLNSPALQKEIIKIYNELPSEYETNVFAYLIDRHVSYLEGCYNVELSKDYSKIILQGKEFTISNFQVVMAQWRDLQIIVREQLQLEIGLQWDNLNNKICFEAINAVVLQQAAEKYKDLLYCNSLPIN